MGEDQLSGFDSDKDHDEKISKLNQGKAAPNLQNRMQLAFAQRFKQHNDDRDKLNKSKVSSLKGESKNGLFNHDIPLSPKGYDYTD